MSQTEEQEEIEASGEYSIIPVLSTPKINSGEIIELDYYVTGRHPTDNPPENVRLNVNLGGISVDSAQMDQNIAQEWANDGRSITLKKEKEIQTHAVPAEQGVFSLKLPEAMFFPNKQFIDDSDPYPSPPIQGELTINDQGDPPFRLKIQTKDNQSSGDFNITSTLVFQETQTAGTDKVTNQIHVNTLYERYQFWINAIVIGITLAGVLFPMIQYFFL